MSSLYPMNAMLLPFIFSVDCSVTSLYFFTCISIKIHNYVYPVGVCASVHACMHACVCVWYDFLWYGGRGNGLLCLYCEQAKLIWQRNTQWMQWWLCHYCSLGYSQNTAQIHLHISGSVWESRWPSWAVCPNKPSGFRGRKAILNHVLALVSACP